MLTKASLVSYLSLIQLNNFITITRFPPLWDSYLSNFTIEEMECHGILFGEGVPDMDQLYGSCELVQNLQGV